MNSTVSTLAQDYDVISREELLKHWQGHRELTRRVIEAFPDDKLFSFSIGGMRSFGELALELLSMGGPTARGLATDVWESDGDRSPKSKEEILRLWDESTRLIDDLWSQVKPGRFHEEMVAFGQWPGTGISLLLYVIDNEIHHRGQGYVYLRALGIEPPPFWDRP